jgi:hypothetical protein
LLFIKFAFTYQKILHDLIARSYSYLFLIVICNKYLSIIVCNSFLLNPCKRIKDHSGIKQYSFLLVPNFCSSSNLVSEQLNPCFQSRKLCKNIVSVANISIELNSSVLAPSRASSKWRRPGSGGKDLQMRMRYGLLFVESSDKDRSFRVFNCFGVLFEQN